MSDKCYFFLLFSLMYFRNWSVLFYSTVGHSLSPTHSLPFHLKGSAFVCSHAYIISVKIRLDLLPNLLLRIQLLVGLSRESIKSNSVPGTDPSGGTKISTFSGELAHITIAWDTTPLIFAGFRLQSKTTIWFCICSRGTWFTRPLTIVLGAISPTSTSTYKESASGCFLAVMIKPIRRSRRETSTGLESALPATGCCFFSFFSPKK